MIITCPRCSTRYVIDPAVLVPDGRAVGCSNCGHHWTQQPPQRESKMPPAAAAGSAEEAAKTLAQPEPAAGKPEEAGEDLPTSDAPLDGAAEPGIEPESEAEGEPGGDAEPRVSGGEKIEPETADAVPLEPAGAPAGVADEQPKNQDRERREPSVPEEQTRPMQPESQAEAGDSPPSAFGSAVGAEPIPAALRKGTPPAEPGGRNRKKKPSVAMLAGIGALAALIVIAVGAILARGPIVSAIPDAAGFYRALGFGGEEFGAGLEIRDVRSGRRRDGADEILTIEGMVANVTDEPLDLPAIRVSLSDADGEELQFETVRLDRPVLPPGETVSFEARITNPSAIVRRVKVKFQPPSGDGH